MSLYEKIKNKEEKISIIGLGYVGMPIAISFAKKCDVIGFDIVKEKVQEYHKGIDATNEVGDKAIKETNALFTWDEEKLKECKFHIVAVPTPIKEDNTPNLQPVISASETLGRNLTKGSVVVYESTVYPGVTEEICLPILERESGLKAGIDFKIGYSPERINPGDKVNKLETIVKVVSGMDDESLDDIAKTYELIIDAGVHRATSIKVAEAAKVIENSQRDINIAFMNELSIIFNMMDIDTKSVLEAAGTKWNFLNFTPGLVGGHCIGVDPYYLTYKAEQMGYHSQIVLAGRRINDNMGKYVAENIIKYLIKADKHIKGAKVVIFGFTFKENVPDTRNTKVMDIINELNEYEVETIIVDPVADSYEMSHEHSDILIKNYNEVYDVDAAVFAVSHEEFKDITLKDIKKHYKNGEKVLFDIKGIFNKEEAEKEGYLYWRM